MQVTIMVRSRVRTNRFRPKERPKYRTEWDEITYSWKKAWSIVDDCAADRSGCHKWQFENDKGFWYLDIGGVQELEDRRGWLDNL